MNTAVMIKSIIFNDRELTTFEPSKLNVIIGANNSGKSRLLKEIRAKLLGTLVSEPSQGIDSTVAQVASHIDLSYPATFNAFCKIADLDNRVSIDSNGNYEVNDFCSTGLQVGPDNTVAIGSTRVSW